VSHVALVTGASRGIGTSIAQALKADGWEVLAPTRAELDLESPASISAYLAELATPVSGLVLNAGINFPAGLEALTLDQWRAINRVNTEASFELVSALVPAMVNHGFGRLVAISSAYSLRAREGRAAYSASKAALEALIRSVALEFAGNGVLANAVAPGFVDTDMTRRNNSAESLEILASRIPVGRLASVEEIGRVVAFLMSPENTYVNGQTLNVDGGFSCR